MEKTAAYCEGFLAYQTRKECRYGPDQSELRTEWAAGFCEAVAADRESKKWYKSKTMLTGLGCIIVGVGMLIYSFFSGGVSGSSGLMMASAGAATSASGVIFSGLRLLTKEPIGNSAGYGNQSWGN